MIEALNKWRLIAKLDQIRADGEPQLSLVGGNGLYTEAETVVFDIRSPVYSNIILFNLAYDGTIQHLAPSIPDDPGLAGGHIIPQHSIPVPSIVVPPFGADHLFAIVSPAPLIGLAGRINDLDGTAKTDLLFNEWDTYTKGNRNAVSRIGLYTRGKQ